MQCPHCGAEVLAGNTFCQRCRKRVIPPSTSNSAPRPEMRQTPLSPPAPAARPSYSEPVDAPQTFTRPGWVTLLAVLSFAAVLPCLIVTAAIAVPMFISPTPTPAAMWIIPVLGLGFAVLNLIIGIGLWRLRPWARTVQIVFAIIGLLGVPIGTLISVILLVYLFKPGSKILFSGRGPSDLSAQEWEDVRRASGGAALLVIVVVLLALVAILLVAAIAIPSLLRARMAANESAAIGQLRAIVSAETSYAAMNGGLYDDLDCLMAPAKCIPGAASASPLLDPQLSEKTLRGYRFRFFAGAKPEPGTVDPSKVSPSSVASFSVVAEPLKEGATGTRIFCGESTGVICRIASVDPAALSQGCEASCVAETR
jgi:type IV pilus assembly protein PilA